MICENWFQLFYVIRFYFDLSALACFHINWVFLLVISLITFTVNSVSCSLSTVLLIINNYCHLKQNVRNNRANTTKCKHIKIWTYLLKKKPEVNRIYHSFLLDSDNRNRIEFTIINTSLYDRRLLNHLKIPILHHVSNIAFNRGNHTQSKTCSAWIQCSGWQLKLCHHSIIWRMKIDCGRRV